MTKKNRQRFLVVIRFLALTATVGLCVGMFIYAESIPHGPLAFTAGVIGLIFLILFGFQVIALTADAWNWLTKWAEEGE